MAYVDTGQRVAPETLAAWQQAARDLGCERCPTASGFTEDAATRAVVGDLAPFVRTAVWVSCVTLMPSQQINGHVDAPLAVGLTRYHVPLLVNGDCWSYHAGTWQQLEAGAIYAMDPAQPHGAVNWGASPRVHLLVDC